ncbi:TIR domain-containing protein [Aromatoleum diolicum]|uniref:TIR domain-containing protein n=1 Tax=Aromatoleum diolicum TaxID=75796 RepID=A0ABX1QHE5_9RHOO|nr:TIR domain-containing protein [Aromatoleum diolicum]NMG76604.1 TIR domain-containing protein [Aromatoleum diolicum]
MTFDSDVFISYAHLDNQALTAGSQGWVSEFHEALSKRLGEVLGKPPKIWRDPKLQGNDVFADELLERFEHAAVLVSVITPRYVESDWCRRELTGFWQATEHTGGPVVGSKARVFKVVKTPVEQTRMPPPLQPLLGYEFYRLQPGSGRPLEFNKVYGPDAERDFWVRLNDLAYDLADLLTRLEHPEAAPAADKPMVYLATTTSDLQPQRDALRRELLRHGYGVLPDQELPLLAAAFEQSIAAQLERCRVAIHLVGAVYGVVPEAAVESEPALQTQLSAARARAGGLRRLVWIAPGSASDDPRQRAFLDALRDDPAPGPGSDLLETPFEELKSVAFACLQAAEQSPPAAAAPVPGAPARIYLVCDVRDLDAVEPLQQHLFALGFEPTLPAFEGDETLLREDHEAQLRDCNALLIYYGAGGELWLRQKLGELRRIATLGRAAPLRAAAIVVAPPATPAKERLLTHDAMMIAMPNGFAPAALDPFTQLARGAAVAA